MEERKTIDLQKQAFTIKEHVKNLLGKGKVSKVKIEYTPVGERIVISTNRPGVVIGRGGEKIAELTRMLKKDFKLDNPHIEIDEILNSDLDSQIVADEIALGLERFGPLKFKVLAYRALQRIMKAGALGTELRLSGKLPGSRAKVWRFAQGYLKKAGDSAKVVDVANARAETKPGTVGVRVSILLKTAELKDRVEISDGLIETLKSNTEKLNEKPKKATKKKTRKINK